MLTSGLAGNAWATSPADELAITNLVNAVITTLNNRDGASLHNYYVESPRAVFFGLSDDAQLVRTASTYVGVLGACLASFTSVGVAKNNDMRIQTDGPLGFVTLTGTNTMSMMGGVVTSPWRWTIVVKNVAGQWLIAHEHVSFK